MMYDHRKSDDPIGPEKPANKARQPAAEWVEESGSVEGNLLKQNKSRTQGRRTSNQGKSYTGPKLETVDTAKEKPKIAYDLPSALERIRKVAQRDKDVRFTSLYHHIYCLDNLADAYRSLNRKASPGIDGQTWEQYGLNLEVNLQALSDRLRNGAYRAMPVRRVYIPKPDGRQRPLGVTALEDKIVQAATVRVLNAIYESDFKRFSFGFRPGVSPHHALDHLYAGIVTRKVNCVLDCDIRSYFDSISHSCLSQFLEHRIADQRVIRLIRKWLKVGVLEDGKKHHSDEGSPQGGCISPLLANVYLHYVFDLWVGNWFHKRMHQEMVVVRFADDIVVGFQYRLDAEQFRDELGQRLSKFNLKLQTSKTRLIEFGRFAAERRVKRGLSRPETFDFLGFTHICGTNRKGHFMLIRHTMRQRLKAKLHSVKIELKRRMHAPIPEVGRWLGQVIRGHCRYYGVPTNTRALIKFSHKCQFFWHRVLCRRTQNGYVPWSRMSRLVRKWLPPVRIYHPNPLKR